MLVEEFVQAWREYSVTEPVTLLLSGGGDSVALFHLLNELGIQFSCLHFSHDGRAEFARLGVDFCGRLCEHHGVPLEVVEIKGWPLVSQGDLSWEAACRTLRYQALEKRAGTFLTAHTQDDQAETVLLKLLDGSGLSGLAGIASRRPDGVIRPLLCFSRQQLRDYLEQQGREWLEDPTNLDGNERARVRNRLMPGLLEDWPHLVKTLARTARRLSEDENYLRDVANSWIEEQAGPGGDNWSLSAFRELPGPILFRVLKTLGKVLGQAQHRPRASLFAECKRVVEQGGNDSWVDFPGGWSFGVLGERVWVRPALGSPVWELDPLSDVSGPPAFLTLSKAPFEGAEVWRIPPGSKLRNRLPGDRFRGKSVKKSLAAGKAPPWVRDRMPLLIVGHEVLAVWSLPGRACPEIGIAVWVRFDGASLRCSVTGAAV